MEEMHRARRGERARSFPASPSTQPSLKLHVVTNLEALHPFGVLWRPLNLGTVDQIIHHWLLNSISFLPGEEAVRLKVPAL